MKKIIKNVLIGLVITISVALLLVFYIQISFTIKENKTLSQAKIEHQALKKHFSRVLSFLADYKKKNNVYPDVIDNAIVVPNSFKKIEYVTFGDKKSYHIKVYPKKGPVDYYYNDENDNGYNYYQGTGFFDGFMTNEYYYELDKNWHAVMLDSFWKV